MVNESSLTDVRITELKNLVYGCTGIPVDLISISAFDKSALNEPSRTWTLAFGRNSGILNTKSHEPADLSTYIAIGVGFLVLLLVIIVVITIISAKKKENYIKEAEEEERERAKEARRQQMEIESYKRSLEDIAKGKTDPKMTLLHRRSSWIRKNQPAIALQILLGRGSRRTNNVKIIFFNQKDNILDKSGCGYCRHGLWRASEVYKHLSEDEIETLTLEVAKLDKLSPDEMQDIVDDFYGERNAPQKVISERASPLCQKRFGKSFWLTTGDILHGSRFQINANEVVWIYT